MKTHTVYEIDVILPAPYSCSFRVRRRYKEFYALAKVLAQEYNDVQARLPQLPSRTPLRSFAKKTESSAVVSRRLAGLQEWLSAILAHKGLRQAEEVLSFLELHSALHVLANGGGHGGLNGDRLSSVVEEEEEFHR